MKSEVKIGIFTPNSSLLTIFNISYFLSPILSPIYYLLMSIFSFLTSNSSSLNPIHYYQIPIVFIIRLTSNILHLTSYV